MSRVSNSSIGKSQKVELEAHPTEPAIIVNYTPNVNDNKGTPVKSSQSIVYLKDLKENIDISYLSKHILSKTPIIPEHKLSDLEQLCYFIVKRSLMNSSSNSPIISSNLPQGTIPGDITKLSNYIEDLYEELPEKTKAASAILSLACDNINLLKLSQNETLIPILVRVFRDDWKKSYDLAINITMIFVQFSQYSNFHTVIGQNKIGLLFIQMIEFEQKRRSAWLKELKNYSENDKSGSSNGNSKKKWEVAIKKQAQLLASSYQLLLFIGDDMKTEVKIVNKGIIQLLSNCLTLQPSIPLLLVVLNFLWKLSCFVENKQTFIDEGIIEKICSNKIVKSKDFRSDAELRNVVFKILFNLSFDEILRKRMVKQNIITYIAPYLEGPYHSITARNLIYQLSIIDDAKAMITFSDIITILMRKVIEKKADNIDKSLLINVSLEKRNAQLICGSNGKGLEFLIDLAMGSNYCDENEKEIDNLLIKVVRNVASHNGATQSIFNDHKYMEMFIEMFIVKCYKPYMKFMKENKGNEENFFRDNKNLKDYSFGLDCLGTAVHIQSVDWIEVCDKYEIFNILSSAFVNEKKNGGVSDDMLLQLLMFSSTIATTEVGAQKILENSDDLINLLNKKQEDDEIVIQIVYLFYKLLIHESCCIILMDTTKKKSEIAAYLIDLMHDTNEPIRNMCDQALQVISESSKEWAKKIDGERFRWHNAQWLEMINDSISDIENIDLAGDSYYDNGNVVLDVDEFLNNDNELDD
ncbi:Armadillo-like helical domain and Armadillo-type fold domain-containing protein [Strongyloides ratti]|uniref:Armadillo-like helical domain and Armadillo-type fold domain-containing protein n=1 Tax=Strongyloides ratti TaxID=34506 RepID=A0A090LBF2_STRRB|nr:Armadillo-like helical domain and Armadillo-type fold domain-containing protein [Strongyloides ratti]CEF64845.1 Armadillo-like helical domain and Armadillo-type fold domain-containing protein [Strongyloides ratti]